MREIAFKKVSEIMKPSPLMFSSTDAVSEFIGSIHQSASHEAIVVFKNRLGLVTVMEVLNTLHPERTVVTSIFVPL